MINILEGERGADAKVAVAVAVAVEEKGGGGARRAVEGG